MAKKWQIAPPIDTEFINQFPEIPLLVLQLMHNRGLLTQKAIDEFLNPDYGQDSHSPFLFKDMAKAVAEIFSTIEKKEKIAVYGDYDADGVCGSVILTETLSALGGQVEVYIPHREKEGYGLNLTAVKELANNGIKLIITTDCGITNLKETVLANELGLRVIITDHHQPAASPASRDKQAGKPASPPAGGLPAALAVINPKVVGEEYPFKELAGVGVAYKLVQALVEEDKKNPPAAPIGGGGKKLPAGFEKWLLDLVAIGTIADISPILGENRTIVKYGLVVLNKTRRLGLKILMEEAGLSGEVNTQNVAFQLAPRFNAAGRLNHANAVYKLMITGSTKEARSLAEELNRTNQERQRLTDQILTEIRNSWGEVDAKEKVLFAIGDSWPVGVVGLVAGKLCDEYYRPVLVMTRLSGSASRRITGSGRSIAEFNITDALAKTNGLLSRFGGHSQACGFTIEREENLEKFKAKLIKVAEKELKGKDLSPRLEVDATVPLKEINWKIFEQLAKFEPFGEDNKQPKFLALGEEVFNFQPVGNDGKHLRIFLKDETGKIHKTIGFCFGDWCQRLKIGERVDIVFEVDVNEWNGNRELQFKIIDLRLT
ncbi:MAG: DHH family phosphoesterase [bacterium]